MDKDTLLQGDGIEVKASFAEKTFSQVPPAFRKEVEKNLFSRPWAFQWTSLKNRWGRRTSRA
ncbi:MAG: hypothetical protein JRH00_15580 [Deltaproteobacteria bacterium]|nr:hypothetical protein [Deltaproteobacteria bacterium]